MEVFTGEGISSFFRYLALPTNLLYDFATLAHLLSCFCWLFQRHFKKLVPGLAAVGERESVQAPCFRSGINFSCRVGTAGRESRRFLLPNADDLVADIFTATPALLVDCPVSFPCNLAVTKAAQGEHRL